jgi:hypothetical protein
MAERFGEFLGKRSRGKPLSEVSGSHRHLGRLDALCGYRLTAGGLAPVDFGL